MQTLILVGLIVVALVLYLAWAARDKRRHDVAKAVHDDVAALGDDAVPVSIHPEVDPYKCIGSGACVSACPEEHVIALVHGQAKLVNPLACIGHGACLAACPVQAITLVFGTAKRGMELPALDSHFQTSQQGVYIVGELGGMGLIRNAIEQGKQAAEAIAASGRRGKVGALDAVVVGGGPAGISAALGLVDKGLKVELLEQEAFGGTIQHYPRAKVVMTGELDIPRYGKVKARTMSKEELVALWQDIRAKGDLDVKTGERVDALDSDGMGQWLITSTGGTRRAANVVLALGRRGAPKKLGVPGEELAKVAYRLLEPEPFLGQNVLVVGGGNSAAECAIALADYGKCTSVSLSYRRTELARLREQVRNRLEEHIAAGKVRALLPTEVVEIGERTVKLAPAGGGAPSELANDAVIVQIGGASPVALLGAFGIRTVEKRGER